MEPGADKQHYWKKICGNLNQVWSLVDSSTQMLVLSFNKYTIVIYNFNTGKNPDEGHMGIIYNIFANFL